MNDTRLLPDDPKLTAYALGELTGDDRATVEAALRENPALRLTVDEIRATAQQLEAALADEAIISAPKNIVPARGIVIELNGRAHKGVNGKSAGAVSGAAPNGRHALTEPSAEYTPRRATPKLLRFPQVYYVVATAAAACFAVMVALYDPPPPTKKPVAQKAGRVVTLAVVPAPESSETATLEPAPSGESNSSVIPASSANVPPASTTIAENAVPGGTPSASPVFIDRGLTLIDQVKRDQSVATRDAVAAGTVPELSLSAAMPPRRDPRTRMVTDTPGPLSMSVPNLTAPGTSMELIGHRDASTASGVNRSTTTLLSDPFTPSVTAPVVASATPPSVLPNTSVATPLSGASAAPGSGEVVMLSPFMVTSDRAVGYAAAVSTRGASDKRKVARRDDLPHPPPGAKFGRNPEAYSYIRDNDFVSAIDNPLSTFSIDIDTASYANVRRIVELGSPPPRDAVRIEEMLNYFPYRYPAPKGDAAFAAAIEVAEAPWEPSHRLVRVGLKAREVSTSQRPAASLVFLLDVSGSMNQPNKLPLVKHSMRLLVGKLRPDDRVAIVTYAGNSGLALPSTPVAESREIMNALDALIPVASPNGATGVQLAYEIARANFVKSGINRVILCTDGDFNVGTTSEGELVRLIEEKAASGVFLTVLGFGIGNYKDPTLEKLADKGSGSYGYIDTSREAEKLLVEQVSGTPLTVAKDVKIQVEFNPANVSSYRLIGYENRLLRKEDFNNDKVDAGEVGAGHTITALFEIIPVGAVSKAARDVPPLDELRYGTRGAVSSRLEMPSGKRDAFSNELLTVKIRYRKPDSLFSFPKTLEFPLLNSTSTFARASADFRFAAAVAQFGMILRGSPHRGVATMDDVAAWAATAATPADDPGGYRGEFIELVRKAQTMTE